MLVPDPLKFQGQRVIWIQVEIVHQIQLIPDASFLKCIHFELKLIEEVFKLQIAPKILLLIF